MEIFNKKSKKQYILSALFSFITTLTFSISFAVTDISGKTASSFLGEIYHSVFYPLRESLKGFGFVRIILFFSLFLLYLFVYSEYKRIKARHIVPAMLFSVFQIIGIGYDNYGSMKPLIATGVAQWIKVIFTFVGYSLLLCAAIYCADLFLRYSAKKGNSGSSAFTKAIFDKKPFLAPFLIIFAVYLISLLCVFPGIMMGDSRDQICQAFGYVDWTAKYLNLLSPQVVINNHHPVVSTLLIGGFIKLGEKVFNSDNMGLFLYCLVQAGVLAAVEGFTVKYITKFKLPNFVRVFALLFYALQPSFITYAVMAVKDTYFTAALIAYSLFFAELIRKPENVLKKPWRVVLFIVSIAAVCLFRSNGIYVILLSLPFVCCVQKKIAKKILPLTLAVLIVWVGYSNFLLPSLNITPGSKREMLSIPFQQTARYVKEYPTEVTSAEKKAIDAVLDYDNLANNYMPKKSDPVKNSYRKDSTGKDFSNYLKVWAAMLKKHPGVYFEATLNNTYGYVYQTPTHINYDADYSQHMFNIINTHGFNFSYPAATSPLRALIRDYYLIFSETPVISIFQSSAAYSWLLIAGAAIALSFRRKKQFVNYLPSLVLLLTCFASPVDGTIYFRYMVPIAAVMPILLANHLFYQREDEELCAAGPKVKIKKVRSEKAQKLIELIKYVFFGVLATIVNLVSFKIFDGILGQKLYLVTNVISWIITVIFAYITNKLWVFESKKWTPSIVVKEIIGFFGARLFSLGVEEGGLWLLISAMKMGALSFSVFSVNINGNMIAKIIMQIVVVIINYVFSKFIIFKKGKEATESDAEKQPVSGDKNK